MLHRLTVITGLAAALVALPGLTAQQRSEDESGVQEAIRFEKAKQAAADRQARIEEGRSAESNSADRSVETPKPRKKSANKTKTESTSQKPATARQ